MDRNQGYMSWVVTPIHRSIHSPRDSSIHLPLPIYSFIHSSFYPFFLPCVFLFVFLLSLQPFVLISSISISFDPSFHPSSLFSSFPLYTCLFFSRLWTPITQLPTNVLRVHQSHSMCLTWLWIVKASLRNKSPSCTYCLVNRCWSNWRASLDLCPEQNLWLNSTYPWNEIPLSSLPHLLFFWMWYFSS